MENEIKQHSILHWLFSNNVVSEKGEPLDFKDHAFLLDILADWSKNIAVKACAQVGKSVTFNLKSLFACQKFKWNIIYTMPTDGDVREFVATKTNRILMENQQIFGDIQTDNIERKDIDGRTIFFKGTISKSAAISTTADLVIHDEASRSDQEVLNTYKSRTKDSAYKGRWLFSNPTTERDALDLAWQKSDQKEWHITCPNCKDEHFLSFPESIDKEKKCYICKNCKAPISDDVRRGGRWIDRDGIPWEGTLNPRYETSGWHLSHLIATKITAKEILEDSEGDQEYFHNFVLGEPYNPGDLSVSKSTILDIWTPKDIETGNWFLGVDVGNIKHYVLGSELGIVKIGKFTEWSVLDDLMRHYKPRLVIDALPDSTMSKYFVSTYPQALMWYPQENQNNPQTIVWLGEGDRKGIIYSHRDRSLDMMIDDMVQAEFLIGVPSNKDLVEYIRHFETLRRVKETNAKGIERYIWDSTTGVDHYCFDGSTNVVTKNGNKKIKDISIGELVLTRSGYKKVLHSGITKRNTDVYEATFSDGTKIISTKEHPFYVKGFGMKPLYKLLCDDILISCKQKQSYLMELPLEDTQNLETEQIEFILSQMVQNVRRVLVDYMRKYGKILMVKLRKALKYITRIITHSTINWKILNVLKEINIDLFISKKSGKTNPLEETNSKGLRKKHQKESLNLKNGLKQKKVKNISKNIRLICLQTYISNVLNVIRKVFQRVKMEESFVQKNVVQDGVHENGEKNIQNITLVTLKKLDDKRDVYNLHVEDVHEYYANGILVSNCFATLYYRLAILGQGDAIFMSGEPKEYDIIQGNKVGEWKPYFDNLKYSKDE